jgi:polyhydroxyalkanoate synthesis regulator phasin
MANELNRVAMLGVGLLAMVQQKFEDLIEGYTGEEAEKLDGTADADAENLSGQLDKLVELGEEKYDEWVDRVRNEREGMSERLRETVNDLLSSFGLASREELEEMDVKIAKLERLTKQAEAN